MSNDQEQGGAGGLDLPGAAPVTEQGPRFAHWTAAHQQTYKPVWHMDILPLPELSLFPCPMTIGVQVTKSLSE